MVPTGADRDALGVAYLPPSYSRPMGQWSSEVEKLLQDRVFLLVGFTSFLLMTSVPLISPALPAIADSLSVSRSRVGLVITAFTLPAIFILPFSGFLADNLGRKHVMSAGCLLVALGGLIGFLSDSFFWLLGGRVVQGIGYTGVMPLTVTFIGDLYEGALEDEAQGLRTSSIKVGGVVWPVLGGALAAIAWNDVFLAYLLFVPLAPLLWYGLPDRSVHHENAGNYLQALSHIAERPRVAVYLSIGFVRFFLLYSYFTYLPLLLTTRFSIGPSAVGNYVAALGVGGILSAATAGIFAERFRKFTVILTSISLIGVLSIGLAATGNVLLSITAVTLVGMSESLVGPLHKSLLTQNVDEDHRAGIVTLNSVLQNAGKTTAPILIGSIMFLDDLVWLYAVAAVSFVSAIAYFFVRNVFS